ncbi:MAG: hypothetical protein AAGE96_15590 [Cyanobacteria bacterium P01_G01_bin.19]
MIDLRHAPIFFTFMIFGLSTNSNSDAVVIGRNGSNVSLPRVEVLSNDSQIRMSSHQLKLSQVNNRLESSNNKNRYLSILGMAATSALFLTVLAMLFKKEKPIKENKNEYNSNLKSNDLKNSVRSPSNSNLSSDNRRNGELTITERSAKLQSNRSNKPKITISTSDTVIDPNWRPEPVVDSDIMGKLTIVTSTTTEIDVVYELIQDLEQNSSFATGTKQKELRRKAIWELGQTNDFRAVEPLVKTIPKVNSLEKNLILDAITRIASHSLETINEILLTSLEDEKVEIRKNAIQDLTTLYRSMSLITAHLLKMTEDSDQEVQQTAQWALEQFKQMSIPIASIEHKKRNN